MFTVGSHTVVSAVSALQRKDYTWGTLCFRVFGAKNPLLPEIKKSLEDSGSYDMGDGVVLVTKGETSQYHKG